MKEERIFSWLVALAAGVVVYVIVVGGIVCIKDNRYDFGAYLTDVAQVAPYLFGAIAAVLLRSRITRNGKHSPDE